MTKSGKGSVLIVDDDPMFINFLLDMLRDYTIFIARNGHSAITEAMNNIPDFILMDLNMPDMSGYEVMMALRYMKETASIPVILISGDDNPVAMEKGMDFGAVDYIQKNLGADVIIKRIMVRMEKLDR